MKLTFEFTASELSAPLAKEVMDAAINRDSFFYMGYRFAVTHCAEDCYYINGVKQMKTFKITAIDENEKA